MVVNSTVLVADNQNRGAFPKVRVLADCIINSGNEYFSLLNIVIRVLVARNLLVALIFVIGVIGLHKAVLGQFSQLAVLDKLLIGTK